MRATVSSVRGKFSRIVVALGTRLEEPRLRRCLPPSRGSAAGAALGLLLRLTLVGSCLGVPSPGYATPPAPSESGNRSRFWAIAHSTAELPESAYSARATRTGLERDLPSTRIPNASAAVSSSARLESPSGARTQMPLVSGLVGRSRCHGRRAACSRLGADEVELPPTGESRCSELSSSFRRATSREESEPCLAPVLREPAARIPAPAALDELLALGAPLAMDDRTRILDALGVRRENPLNPYDVNSLKGDRPIFGNDWFLSLGLQSHSELELTRVPELASAQPERAAGTSTASVYERRQRFISSLRLVKGNSVFRPADWQFYAKAALTLRHSDTDSDAGDAPSKADWSLEELFVERHLRNKSDRYDFDSVRLGIQPFISDFRGFLFSGAEPGARLFGNASNNTLQYNLAWFRLRRAESAFDLRPSGQRLELRRDDVFVANLYRQDTPSLGFQMQGTLLYRRNRERDGGATRSLRAHGGAFDAVYLGWSGDGHFDRLNLTYSAYLLTGSARRGESDPGEQRIRAHFLAAEASMDFDWMRFKLYGVWSSGDSDPDDGRSEGFDAVRERPLFAGLENSFFQSQSLRVSPGGERLSRRGSLLPVFGSKGDAPGSDFSNPGLRALGIGADLDLLPELRLRVNAAHLAFDAPGALTRRGQSRSRTIGQDLSLALEYRPLFINNVSVQLSVATLLPGEALELLLGSDRSLRAARVRLVLEY